jgi:hypothetical protein
MPAGVLVSINTNTGVAAGSVTLFDGLTAAGKKLGTFSIAAVGQVLANLAFTVGLFAVVVNAANAGDATVGYR